MGADGGIYGEYHVTKPFSISVGLEYSSQGGKKSGLQAFPTPTADAAFVSSPYLYADFKNTAKYDYVLIPILARYTWKISKKSPFRIYGALGPFAGLLLDAKQVTSGNSIIYFDSAGTQPLPAGSQPFNATTNIKNDLNSFNVGIEGFVGISYRLNKKSTVFIEGGGNYGFMSIQKGTANGKNYTGAGVVTIGYAYTIPGKHKYTQSR